MRDFPNIVLITGDHLRWDHVAANGNGSMVTPNMDRLVREGDTFLSCLTAAVAGSPNRASLMTGRRRFLRETPCRHAFVPTDHESAGRCSGQSVSPPAIARRVAGRAAA